MSALDRQVGGEHYKNLKIQPAEFAMANNLNYCQVLILRYMMRYRDKNGAEDIDKGIHAFELLRELEYPEENNSSPLTLRTRPGTQADGL